MTNAWTLPNHWAFIAWMVYLQHDSKMLSFLLDFVEVPEVNLFYLLLLQTFLLPLKFELHTGVVMANAFQEMLECFGLQDKVRQIIYLVV